MSDQRFRDLGDVSAYEILGVPEDASKSEIQRAYLSRVRVTHPDVRGVADADEQTRLLNLARDVLRDRRAEYDAYLGSPEPERTVPSRSPGDARAADDPWDHADSGPPIPDPWTAADPGPPQPPPRPMPYPPPRPMPHPPSYPSFPGAWRPPHPPPRRHLTGCQLLSIILVLLLSTGLVSVVAIVALSGKDQNVHEREKPEAAIPDRFAGTWAGTIKYSNDAGKSKVRITLPRGRKSGMSRYSSNCSQRLVPMRVADDALTLHEAGGEDCNNAWITATPLKHHRLRLRYSPTEDGERYATATVTQRGH